MVKVIMHGCNGKMGQVITRLIEQEKDMEIVAGIDLYDGIQNTYPVFPLIKISPRFSLSIPKFINAPR